MPRSGAKVASVALIGGTNHGRPMERGRGGRRDESVPFSSLAPPSLSISLCSSALAPVGGAGLHAAVWAAWRAARAGSDQMDVQTSYRYHYYCLL